MKLLVRKRIWLSDHLYNITQNLETKQQQNVKQYFIISIKIPLKYLKFLTISHSFLPFTPPIKSQILKRKCSVFLENHTKNYHIILMILPLTIVVLPYSSHQPQHQTKIPTSCTPKSKIHDMKEKQYKTNLYFIVQDYTIKYIFI